MGEEFRLRPFGFEGKGVIGENGDLSGVGDDGDPPIGGVPGIEEPGMIPGRHPPVQGLDLPEEDRQQCGKAGGHAAVTGTSFPPEKEQGRTRRDEAAGEGQREILDSPPEAEGGQQSPRQGAGAFDPVGAGQCPVFSGIENGGGAEQETREQADRRKGDDQRRHLMGNGKVGAGDAAEDQAARPEEDDAEGQEKGEQKQQDGRPIRRRGISSAHGDRPQGGEEKPDAQGDQIDQLDAEEGDVELPQKDDLSDQRDKTRQEQRDDGGDHRVSASPKTSAWKVENCAPSRQAAAGESRLLAEVVQHLVPPPALFRGDLGEKHRRSSPFLEEDAVPPDDDGFGAGNRFHRCEDGDLDLQIGQLLEGDGGGSGDPRRRPGGPSPRRGRRAAGPGSSGRCSRADSPVS